MDAQRARALVAEERARVEALLGDLGSAEREADDAESGGGDQVDVAQPLVQLGVDEAVATSLQTRLAALDRADQRISDGTYGRSVRSGAVIPDERLEADPAAELTVQEAAEAERR